MPARRRPRLAVGRCRRLFGRRCRGRRGRRRYRFESVAVVVRRHRFLGYIRSRKICADCRSDRRAIRRLAPNVFGFGYRSGSSSARSRRSTTFENTRLVYDRIGGRRRRRVRRGARPKPGKTPSGGQRRGAVVAGTGRDGSRSKSIMRRQCLGGRDRGRFAGSGDRIGRNGVRTVLDGSDVSPVDVSVQTKLFLAGPRVRRRRSIGGVGGGRGDGGRRFGRPRRYRLARRSEPRVHRRAAEPAFEYRFLRGRLLLDRNRVFRRRHHGSGFGLFALHQKVFDVFHADPSPLRGRFVHGRDHVDHRRRDRRRFGRPTGGHRRPAGADCGAGHGRGVIGRVSGKRHYGAGSRGRRRIARDRCGRNGNKRRPSVTGRGGGANYARPGRRNLVVTHLGKSVFFWSLRTTVVVSARRGCRRPRSIVVREPRRRCRRTPLSQQRNVPAKTYIAQYNNTRTPSKAFACTIVLLYH